MNAFQNQYFSVQTNKNVFNPDVDMLRKKKRKTSEQFYELTLNFQIMLLIKPKCCRFKVEVNSLLTLSWTPTIKGNLLGEED